MGLNEHVRYNALVKKVRLTANLDEEERKALGVGSGPCKRFVVVVDSYD